MGKLFWIRRSSLLTVLFACTFLLGYRSYASDLIKVMRATSNHGTLSLCLKSFLDEKHRVRASSLLIETTETLSVLTAPVLPSGAYLVKTVVGLGVAAAVGVSLDYFLEHFEPKRTEWQILLRELSSYEIYKISLGDGRSIDIFTRPTGSETQAKSHQGRLTGYMTALKHAEDSSLRAEYRDYHEKSRFKRVCSLGSCTMALLTPTPFIIQAFFETLSTPQVLASTILGAGAAAVFGWASMGYDSTDATAFLKDIFFDGFFEPTLSTESSGQENTVIFEMENGYNVLEETLARGFAAKKILPVDFLAGALAKHFPPDASSNGTAEGSKSPSELIKEKLLLIEPSTYESVKGTFNRAWSFPSWILRSFKTLFWKPKSQINEQSASTNLEP